MKKNAFYAQSGGVTAVINTSAAGVIETARQHSDKIGTVYAGENGIVGALLENLIDTAQFSDQQIAALKHTPAGAFGSCRYKLKSLKENRREYERLIAVFDAHDIGYFFYNGGNDSQDTAFKVSRLSEELGYPIQCIGVPKTIDNDLPLTDNCPGFASVAKYVATSTLECGLDVKAMSLSTKVFILEVMGRHAGWIAAAAGLAANNASEAPHMILFPEIAFDQAKFLAKVKQTVEEHGYCVIVASEGTSDADGNFIAAASGIKDHFGHTQLGGVADTLSRIVRDNLGYKYHYAIADYMQRSARHLASQVDVDHAYAAGKAAVEFAIAGKNAVMPIIVRDASAPYQWHIGEAPLDKIANVEKTMPRDFISDDGFNISEKAREYFSPLMQGEAYPPYVNGLPDYARLTYELVAKKLASFELS
jgi:ATP-dependent phosphofructokinase / diphosphate-dependent phosphofructokinase